MGQQHVDSITGIDEARHGRGRRDRHAHRTRAGLEYGRHEAACAGQHELAFGDRLAGRDRAARHGADEIRQRALAFDDVCRRQAALRPGLPAHVVGLDDLAGMDRVACDQHLQRRRPGGRFAMLAELCHQGGALVLQPGPRHKGGRGSDDDREEQEDDALAIHDTAPSCSRCIKRCDDPQAAGSDCRAIGQTAAQSRANGAVGRGCRGADRRTGKDRKTERAAYQGGDDEKIDQVRGPGEQAGGGQQLHVAAAQDASGKTGGADGEYRHGCRRSSWRASAGDSWPSATPAAAHTANAATDRQRQAVGDPERAQVLPAGGDQEDREGRQTAGLKKRKQRHPTPIRSGCAQAGRPKGPAA